MEKNDKLLNNITIDTELIFKKLNIDIIDMLKNSSLLKEITNSIKIIRDSIDKFNEEYCKVNRIDNIFFDYHQKLENCFKLNEQYSKQYILDNILNELFENYGPVKAFLTEHQLLQTSKYQKNIKHAIITNIIYKKSIENEFKETLFNELSKKKSIDKREKIINYALQAHNEKKYYYSIPIFLTQIEGIILDYLIIMTDIKSKVKGKRKYYYYETENKKENKIENIGKKLIEFKDYIGDLNISTDNETMNENIYQLYRILRKYDEFIKNNRNDILHGNNVKFYNCSLSCKLLIILYHIILIFPENKNKNNY